MVSGHFEFRGLASAILKIAAMLAIILKKKKVHELGANVEKILYAKKSR